MDPLGIAQIQQQTNAEWLTFPVPLQLSPKCFANSSFDVQRWSMAMIQFTQGTSEGVVNQIWDYLDTEGQVPG